MATLTIRNLPDAVHSALRVRAAKHGRSMEEEARLMIAAGTGSDPSGQPFDPADALAAASEIRELMRAANGGQMPRDSVDAFLADKRAEIAREEAEYAAMVARHHEWGLK